MSYKYSIPKRRISNREYTREELYREYHPIVLKLLIMKKKSIMDAEDIAQDVFVYILEIWDKIKWENIENLISIILYQSVVRHYRQFDMDDNKTSGSAFIELLDSEVVRDPLDYVILNDFRKTLQGALATLSVTERDLFYGFYIEDKSVEELRGSRHRGAIHNLLFRARSKVSAHFEKNYPKD